MHRYDSDKIQYDPTLETKVEGAIARAGVMMLTKKSTANAQGATNAP